MTAIYTVMVWYTVYG